MFVCRENKDNDDFDDDDAFQISATSALADGIKTGDCLTDTLSVSNPGGSSPPGDWYKEDKDKYKYKKHNTGGNSPSGYLILSL